MFGALERWFKEAGLCSGSDAAEKRGSFMKRELNNSCQWSNKNEERNGTRLSLVKTKTPVIH